MWNYFYVIMFVKFVLVKRDNYGRKIFVNGLVFGWWKEKKILGFCKINDCVMWNYNVFMFFCELKFLEFLKLIKVKIN